MTLALMVSVFLQPPWPSASAHRAEPSGLARDDALPPAMANVSQDPWEVRRGEDVAVYVRLAAGWEREVGSMSLRYCRVEPSYVCWPKSERLQPVGDSPNRWAAVVPWNTKLVKPDTVHVGYNISLVYANGSSLAAPTRNYDEPPAFPLESGGIYFFYHLYGKSDDRPLSGAGGAWMIVAAMGAALLAGRSRRMRGTDAP